MDKDEALRKLDGVTAELIDIYAWLEKQDIPPPNPPPPIDVFDELPLNKDARYPFPKKERSLADIKWLTIHHSAGQRATTSIEWWNDYHTQTKGWTHVGYHFGIASLRRGDPINLYQMNPLKWVTWHDTRNYDTVGICIAGDLRMGHDVRPTPLQVDLFGRLMAWLIPQLPNLFAIVGHRRWQKTACPGDMEVWMPDLIASAEKWGQPIEHLVSYRRARLSEKVRRAVVALDMTIPAISDYDEHEGIGQP